ncbi:MAG: hypothetical protein VST64_09675 [Nitrospirota bacterium]|nr:hypothetical protein [Nitrospirota bacterium]
MKTLICSTCRCSMVRLGVSTDEAATYRYNNQEYRFCCQKCADVFSADPQTYLQIPVDLIVVCPTCLGEKPLQWAVKLTIAGQEAHFCGCPLCSEAFQKNPEFYVKRLAGTIPNEGVVDHEGSSVRAA